MKKLFIVKIGGNVIDDESNFRKFISDFSMVKECKILVHGGGKMASAMAEKLGISQQMQDGRRITDAETLKVVTMVYAGLINKQAVAMLQSCGVNAIGLSGADGNAIEASKRKNNEIDYGFVGDIAEDGVNTKWISSLLEKEMCPVFCSLTHDGKGQVLNTNADSIAAALAVSLSKAYEVQLNYCFEKKGVMKNIDDENSVIDSISKKEYSELLSQGIISKGMIPKLDNAFEAIHQGVHSVFIGHSGEVLNMLKQQEHVGTKLIA